jgi:O-antigen ligase
MKRERLIFAAALLAFIASCVALGLSMREQIEGLRGYVDPSRSADLPYRIPRLGVNAELTQYAASELAEQLALMRDAQIHWVRQIVRWDQVEPQAGAYQWEQWDRIADSFRQNDELELVVVLTGAPSWARDQQAVDHLTAPPADPAQFAAFAGTFAQRYGDVVDVYQIWDEPNLTDAWGGLEPRPVDYAALLREAYAAIHGADAGATVITAALAPTTETGPDNLSDWLYLRDLYAIGLKDFSDAIAAKPFGFSDPADDRTVDAERLNFSRIVALREIMEQHDDGRTPLWASSWGWNTLPADWTGSPSIWGAVSGDQQVSFSLAAIERADREWPWLGGLILHHWQPDVPADDPQWGFALLDAQGAPNTLYEALRERPIAQAAANGLHHPANPHASYSGVWTFGELGADIGWLQDSQFTFDFSGSDVSLLVRQDDYVAFLYATIDGQPANALPRDASGSAYINLKSDTLEPVLQLVPVGAGLGPGQHQLHVSADRGWDRWALAGYAVSAGSLAQPFERQTAVAALTTIVTSLALLAAAWRVDWRAWFSPVARLWTRLEDVGQITISALTSIALMIGMLLTWGDGVPSILRRDSIQFGIAAASAGLIYLEPGFLLTVVAGIILFAVLYSRLDLGLLLIVFYGPFFLFPVELFQFAFPMVELVTLLTAGAWLLRALADWGQSRQSDVSHLPGDRAYDVLRRLTLLDWAVGAWLVLAVISLMWAQQRGPALTELRTLVVEPVLFYVVLRTIRLDRRGLQRLVDALVLSATLVALIGLLQYVQGVGVVAEDGARRLVSVYGSPNNVGLLLGRAIPFALAMLLVPLDRTRRLFAAGALLVILPALALSQSAGALFLGVPAGIATVILAYFGRRAWLPLVGLGAAAAAALAIALQSARFARILDFEQGTNFFRVRVWQSALAIIGDHPLTGLGLDQFLYAYRGRYMLPDAWQEPDLSHPHNFILDVWTRLGILGVALFAVMQVEFWRRTIRLLRHLKTVDSAGYAIVLGMTGSMANLLVHGLVDNSIFVIDLGYVFFLLLGLSIQISEPSRDRGNAPAP